MKKDENKYIEEVCDNCQELMIVKWEVETDGYAMFCPHCGHENILCSTCGIAGVGDCQCNKDTGICIKMR